MTHPSALTIAIALFREPTRVKYAREAKIPDDISFLLRMVSRDEQAIEEAVQISQRSADFVVAAAEFFVEQVLFAPDADSYRTLGGTPGTARETLRRHMVMLLKWLHPDASSDEMRATLAVRATKAWNNLKTQDRRTVYDASRPEVAARALLRHAAQIRKSHGPRRPNIMPRLHPRGPDLSRSEIEDIAPMSAPTPASSKPGPSGLLAVLVSFFRVRLRRV